MKSTSQDPSFSLFLKLNECVYFKNTQREYLFIIKEKSSMMNVITQKNYHEHLDFILLDCVHTHRYTHTHKDTHRHRDTHRHTHRHRDTHRLIHRHTQRHRDTHGHTHIQTHRYTHIETHTGTQKYTHAYIHRLTHRHTQGHKNTQAHTQTHTHTRRDTHGHTPTCLQPDATSLLSAQQGSVSPALVLNHRSISAFPGIWVEEARQGCQADVLTAGLLRALIADVPGGGVCYLSAPTLTGQKPPVL